MRFRTTASGRVCLDVIDLLGRRVRSLADGWRSPGAHAATRDGRDDLGTQLPAGIYWLRVSLGHRAVARRVLRLR